MRSISPAERAFRVGLPVVVTVGLLAAVARVVDSERVGELLLGARPGGVVAAAGMVPVQVGLAARRWRAASRSLAIDVGTGEAFGETGLATLLNQLLPSGLAGEVARVWRQRRPGRSTSDVVGAAVTDRGLGLATFVLVLVASLLAWPLLHPGAPPWIALGIGSVVGLGLAGALALPGRVPGLGVVAGAVRRAVLDREHRAVLVATSGGFLAAIFVQAALCAWAIGLPAGLRLVSLLPLYLLAMLVPLSVGGWGPKEAAALGLFPLLGWTGDEAAAFSTLFGLTTLLGSVGFGLVTLRPRGGA